MQKYLNKILFFFINLLLVVIIVLVIKNQDEEKKLTSALNTTEEQVIGATGSGNSTLSDSAGAEPPVANPDTNTVDPVVSVPVPANPPAVASPVTPAISVPKTPAPIVTSPALIKQDGKCGNASQTFSASTNDWGNHTFCDAGSPDPASPKFPSTGNSTSWKCVGQNGGATVSCRATRKS